MRRAARRMVIGHNTVRRDGGRPRQREAKLGCTIEPSRTGASSLTHTTEPPLRVVGNRRYPPSARCYSVNRMPAGRGWSRPSSGGMGTDFPPANAGFMTRLYRELASAYAIAMARAKPARRVPGRAGSGWAGSGAGGGAVRRGGGPAIPAAGGTAGPVSRLGAGPAALVSRLGRDCRTGTSARGRPAPPVPRPTAR